MRTVPNLYNGVPVTQRPAAELAVHHGYESLDHMIDELPEQARVLDVGAGRSPFGRVVAEVRPDIEWTNVDPAYADRQIRRETTKDAPANLFFDQADFMNSCYEPETFDAVFSYWLLQHLVAKRTYAEGMVAKMFDLAKFGGKVSIGPVFEKWDAWFDPKSTEGIDATVRIIKMSDHSAEVLAKHVTESVLYPLDQRKKD